MVQCIEFVPPSAVTPLLYSPAEAAKALGMSKSKLYELWRSDPANAPPSFMIGGNRYVSVATLNQWIADRERAAGPTPIH